MLTRTRLSIKSHRKQPWSDIRRWCINIFILFCFGGIMANEGNEAERGFLTRWLLHYADFLHQTKLLTWRFYIEDTNTSTKKKCNAFVVYLIVFHCNLWFLIRFQAHFLVDHRVRSDGMCRHLPLQQHNRLHERHRGDHCGHDDRSSLWGLLPFRGCVQHKSGIKT